MTVVRITAGIELSMIGCDGCVRFTVVGHLNKSFLLGSICDSWISHTQPPTHSHKIEMTYTARLDRLLAKIGTSSGNVCERIS